MSVKFGNSCCPPPRQFMNSANYHGKVRLLIFVLALSIVAISCGQKAFDLSRCQRIPATESREFVLQMDIEGLTGIRYIMAVKSANAEFWFVAMDLEGPGLESPTDMAVWAADRIEPFQGPFIPANELAIRYSGQGGAAEESLFAPETDGLADAVRCSRYIGAQ